MSRAVILLTNPETKDRAIRWIRGAKPGTRLTFQEAKRTVPQNDRMWAQLTEVARQLDWHGQKYSPDDWKDYFMHAMKRARWMPSEDGGMVPIGMRTSDLDKAEMGELMDLIEAFGAEHGVEFHAAHEAAA